MRCGLSALTTHNNKFSVIGDSRCSSAFGRNVIGQCVPCIGCKIVDINLANDGAKQIRATGIAAASDIHFVVNDGYLEVVTSTRGIS